MDAFQHTPRSGMPLLDDLGKAIVEGREVAEYLWQVPDDDRARARLVELLAVIRRESSRQSRNEMPRLCNDLVVAAKASPSPQQVEIIQNGFDRLYKLWHAAKSGLV